MDQDVEVTLTYIFRNGIQIFYVKEDEIMAVSGIGNNYSYPVQNGISTDTKDVKKGGTGTIQNSSGVSYEKTISDSTSAGLEFMKKMEKENSGTKFFVGTVSYGQTYGNSTDTNFVVNPKFLSKLGTDEATQKQFEEDVKYLHDFAQRQREQAKASGREIISQGWFCDENGNWGGWTVSRATDKTSVLQDMSDKAKEIREEKLAEKKEKQLKEKKQAEKELREHLGDRFKGMNDISVDKPEIINNGVSVSISKTGKEKVNDVGGTNQVKAKDNKIVFNDPIMDACSQYGTLISINEDGVPQWEINPGDVSKFDRAVEEGLRKFGGRDNYNFWMRLTQNPTFMGLTYSAEDTRNRLHSASIQKGFFQVTVGEHTATQFLSEGKNAAAVYSKAYYDDQYYNYVKSGGICRDYEPGDVFKIDGEEYTVSADRKLDVPYGADIWNIEWPKK